MPHPALADDEIDRRGQELYHTRLRTQLDTPENQGKQLVMDVETEAYELDNDGLAASRRLLARHPGAALYGLRIGYNAVYALGGVLTPTTNP